MPVTTVLGEDSAAIVAEEPRRFSWSAAFAGAFAAAGVTFLLLTLGSGIGLSLVSARGATSHGTVVFLTLGAIYFLAAQAFGFAVGGHVAGRLIGPALETAREEDFRAGVHGLVSWAVAVVATATVVAVSALAAGSIAADNAVTNTLAATNPVHGDSGTNAMTAYWADRLFRPANADTASLAGRKFAQADTGSATDMPSTAEPTPAAPTDTPQPADTDTAPARSRGTVFLNGGGPTSAPTTPVNTMPLPVMRSLGADKAEAGRILAVGMANGAQLSSDDRLRLAQLVSADTGLTAPQAERRVDAVANRMHDDAVTAADLARKTAAYTSLWTAFALLFGAIVAVFAAVSARWEDDREAGLFPGTRVSETRF